MDDCLFCRIAAGTVPATIVHRDEETIAFRDINPRAPFHVLVVPRKHLATMNDLGPEDERMTGHLFRVAASLVREAGYAERGWRAVMNANADAGQTVFHLHLHVLAGRAMTWPPG